VPVLAEGGSERGAAVGEAGAEWYEVSGIHSCCCSTSSAVPRTVAETRGPVGALPPPLCSKVASNFGSNSPIFLFLQ
jgi:hypothetical protein